MESLRPPLYVAPFDAVADGYDESFTHSHIGLAQRAAVWAELTKTFHSGDRILEIGCGTGVDACFLAGRGIEVVACDNSPRMLAAAARRIAETRQTERVQTRLLGANAIGELRDDRRFDGAFSNFGALNCVSDLRRVAAGLTQLVRPGGAVVLCLMGPCCLWEIAWYLAHANPRKAFRRFRRAGVDARLADRAIVHVSYPSARYLIRTFTPQFRLRTIKGIGVAVPPSYLERIAARFPKLLAWQNSMDRVLGQCPAVRLTADHLLFTFERAGNA